ncbi:hypothetical protein SIN8267_00955 [Sinobacterium norvegicum]|uniref:Uncharacterized protein n=1 Tax=Sinobacterium norvegicum TaxID=1641715 RepID=A0ABM9ACC7_9GAMM|nr:hypothetical protein [Sinobacterium norvegicum]CAH0990855.1 hypothetical protein SIN8267_00955 [Sinobacterium norvegicum]
MKTSTASIILYGSILTAALFSTQIKQTYNGVIQKISENHINEKPTNQIPAPTQVNNHPSSHQTPDIVDNALSRGQAQECLAIGDHYSKLITQHSTTSNEHQHELAENQLHSFDLKEQVSELKSLNKEIDRYNYTLDSFRQPVPSNQVDEYNAFTDTYNALVDASWKLEENIKETQSMMNQTAHHQNDLALKLLNTTKEIISTEDQLKKKCIINKKFSDKDLRQLCGSTTDNFFCSLSR